ncbi:hypothetical protein Pcinc_000569 [Petrolisthes cinctipes]|uniref:Uncharacterized protein n=1 Tax=Petrolisthes cinctipes TaxID=88211 RepID=A0AAE1GPC0_PETCI|nr:hypothetical protein Pcinc_000569 [Petrolisthes cinctipes]
MKQSLFRNLRKLQGNNIFKDIRVSNDRTKREKEHDSNSWKEVENLEVNGKGKHVVVGPPWNRRIVKLRTAGQPTTHQAPQEDQGTAHRAQQEDLGAGTQTN